MPDISVSIDARTLREVEELAQEAGLSISSYVASILREKSNTGWPESFFSLFGSLSDDSFVRPEDTLFKDEIPRDSL